MLRMVWQPGPRIYVSSRCFTQGTTSGTLSGRESGSMGKKAKLRSAHRKEIRLFVLLSLEGRYCRDVLRAIRISGQGDYVVVMTLQRGDPPKVSRAPFKPDRGIRGIPTSTDR